MAGTPPRVGEAIVSLRSLVDRFRTSLFGLPAIWVLGGVVLSQAVIELDRRTQERDLPSWLSTTVSSSRALLGAITSGTITAASVVFSLTLVAVQLSSSTYSSRVVRTFQRDRFQQNVIGLVLAAFFYSVLVLREIRGPLDEEGTPYIPRLSIALAVVLALAALLGLLASINHTSRQLRVSAVSRQIVSEVRATIDARFPLAQAPVTDDALAVGSPAAVTAPLPLEVADQLSDDTLGGVVVADRSGWVQQISTDAILEAAPEETLVRLEVAVGTYVVEGSPVLTVWPVPVDSVETRRDRLLGAFALGDERTLQQDVGLGIVMLEDIALRALSPGINDPNTARVIIVQLGEVILDLFRRDLGSATRSADGKAILRPSEPTHEDYAA
ncbi:MAG: DUF2254 domain-containing protein, partial [Acidimicrobiia bacterium]|nr:DUF2254 domain-containing protein [Acidimicrobiia bacterium]